MNMLESFIHSWPLFQTTYLTGLLMAPLLAVSGILLLARRQVFMGASLAQASTLGYAILLFLNEYLHRYDIHLHRYPWIFKAGAIGFCLLANIMLEKRSSRRADHDEAAIGWMFLFSASLAVLVVAGTPLGMEEVQRLLSSSLIGTTATDAFLYAGLVLLAAGVVIRYRDTLLVTTLDPAFADAIGLSSGRWRLMASIWLAFIIGLSISTAGLLFTFACLILPGMMATRMTGRLKPMFWAAPLIATLFTLLSFILALRWDMPPGQLTAGLLSLGVAAVWSVKR